MMHKRISIFLGTLFLSACGLMPHKEFVLYDGQRKPLDQVASIAEDTLNMSITEIDNRRIRNIWIGNVRSKGIHILPGTHTFHWVYFEVYGNGHLSAKGDIEATVSAGHSYILEYFKSKDDKYVYVKLNDKGKNYNQECLKDTVLKGEEKANNC